jgi:hypothetical protein
MDTLEVRLHKIICHEATDNLEWLSDEIRLSGITTDATGDSKIIAQRKFKGFDNGDSVTLSPPLTLASFKYAHDDMVSGESTGWSRTWHATLLVAEEDQGGFPKWVTTIFENLKAKVTTAVAGAVGAAVGGAVGSALGGVIGAAVGAVVGWVLGKLFEWLKELWEDDPFPPMTTACEIPDPHYMFGEDRATSPRSLQVKAYGGKYEFQVEWRLRGVPSVVGVFKPEKVPHQVVRGDSKTFGTAWKEVAKAGNRLVDVGTYVDGNSRIYAAVLQTGTGGHLLLDDPWTKFMDSRTKYNNEGFHLVGIDTYRSGGEVRAIGAMRPGQGKEIVIMDTWKNFVAGWIRQVEAGMRLDRLTSYNDGKSQIFVGVLHEGSGRSALWQGVWPDFVGVVDKQLDKGLRLVDIATYMSGAKRKYVGVFRPGTGGQLLYRTPNWKSFDPIWQAQSKAGRSCTALGV